MVLSVQTKLLRSIDEHLASYVELWHQLDSSNRLPDNQSFLTPLATILQQRGLQSQLLDQQLLYAELKNEAPRTLLFYSTPRLSSHGIQELTDIAALLSALDACKKVLGFVPVNIQWLLDGNGTGAKQKELGMLQSDGCICYHPTDTGLVSDGTPTLALATKGHLHVELAVQTASGTIESMHGGIAPDALWRLLWALGTLKDAREDILIEGFYETLTSMQDDVIAQLHTLPDGTHELTQHWGIPHSLMSLHGFQLHYVHFLLPTCTVNSITSDAPSTNTANEQTETFLPTQAKAEVEFYLVPDQNPQDIFNKLERHLHKQGFSDVQARILSAASPLSTPVNNSFIQMAISATEKAYEQRPHVLPTTVGSYTSPARWMKDGMPIVFMARNNYNIESDTNAFARIIKQIALLIEGMTYATGTTE